MLYLVQTPRSKSSSPQRTPLPASPAVRIPPGLTGPEHACRPWLHGQPTGFPRQPALVPGTSTGNTGPDACPRVKSTGPIVPAELELSTGFPRTLISANRRGGKGGKGRPWRSDVDYRLEDSTAAARRCGRICDVQGDSRRPEEVRLTPGVEGAGCSVSSVALGLHPRARGVTRRGVLSRDRCEEPARPAAARQPRPPPPSRRPAAPASSSRQP